MIYMQPIFPIREQSQIYFNFIKSNIDSIKEIHAAFTQNKHLPIINNTDAIPYANLIWHYFINEPGDELNLAILDQLNSAYAYALRVLYLHLSNQRLRPNQGIYTDDHVAVQSILLCLQSVFNDPVFHSKLDSTRRSQQKNRDSLCQYATDLKQIYSKLMVLRVDFGYTQLVSKTALPVARIENDWHQLLQYVQTDFTDSLAGYAVKFERGNDKGLHAHSVFFFDGNVVCNDAKIGRILGEYWEQVITQGQGVHYNCNTSDHKASLRVCGLGTFTGREKAFWDGVWIIADYLSKPDAMVRLLLPPGTKIFRRGYLNQWQQLKLADRQEKPCATPIEFSALGGTNNVCVP